MDSYRDGAKEAGLHGFPAELTLALDAGGTFLKGAILMNGQVVPGSFICRPSNSQASADIVIKGIAAVCVELLDYFITASRPLCPEDRVQIGFAFPGPFDYNSGTAHLQGVGKYDNLYRLSVHDLLQAQFRRLQISSPGIVADCLAFAGIKFGNDAAMFGLGTSLRFPSQRLICLTLGTGVGSVFIADKQMITSMEGLPKSGMLYNEPYGDDIVDNQFGRRGILRMAASEGIAIEDADVADLAAAAEQGSEEALRLFHIYGTKLGDMLLPYAAAFKPDHIVLGGQISASFPLWEASFRQALGSSYAPTLALPDAMSDVFRGIHMLFGTIQTDPQNNF
ncbi:ROK family protein [Paenibacillus tuaregi]|uniref:ROK family protein n=1 Tax=Paenibacillus tuaregi TaxID=1816681 RepID=UPI0008393A99|nr:ROK family protein [Paenibacillus tuaregi]